MAEASTAGQGKKRPSPKSALEPCFGSSAHFTPATSYGKLKASRLSEENRPKNQNLLETPMTLKSLGLAGIAVAVFASPAFAHHSFAMFDADSKITIEGVVKEFQWTNPHAWIMLTVANTEGKAEPWAIELNGPSGLVRQGWKPKTLTPGMPISLTIHPLKDGTHGGQFLAVTLPDGTQIGNPNREPVNTPAPAAGETQ
jgi:hypothetical protein